jgi:hypothetical protein
MEYEEYLSKLEKVKQVNTLDDYFYHKSSRSNSPYKFEDITFNLLSKFRNKSPMNSKNNSPTNSPVLKPY